MPQLKEEYIKTGKLRYVFRDLPLEQIHPHAFKAAEAANCAGEQGKYWEMHDRLFMNYRQLAPAQLAAHAQAVGLDAAKFAQCMESGKQAAEIRKDVSDAVRANVQSTPHFIVGVTDAKNPREANVRIIKVIAGAQPYAVFKAAIEEALAAVSQETKVKD